MKQTKKKRNASNSLMRIHSSFIIFTLIISLCLLHHHVHANTSLQHEELEDTFIQPSKWPLFTSDGRQATTLIGNNTWPGIGEIEVKGQIGDVCGYAVDISNDGRNIIVGCPHEAVNGFNEAGAAHLFRLYTDEAGIENDRWIRLDVNITGSGGGDNTGYSVSFAKDMNIFAVGSHEYDNRKGRVQVFELKGTTNDPLIEQLGSDIIGENEGDMFGASISLTGDGRRIVVGADGGNYVNILDFNDAIWEKFQQRKGEINDEGYGRSVSTSKDGTQVGIGVVGTRLANGRAEFVNIADNSVIMSLDGANEESLGRSVAVSDDGKTFAVGSYSYKCNPTNTNNCGRVQLFDATSQTQIGNNVIVGGEGDACGGSIDITDFSSNSGSIVIGCFDKVLIASYDGNDLNVTKTIPKVRDQTVPDFFGLSVALSSTRQVMIIGAPGAKGTSNPTINGTVYIFGEADVSSRSPSHIPSQFPSSHPTLIPTLAPSQFPSLLPTSTPSFRPTISKQPSKKPSAVPTQSPTVQPSMQPSHFPTERPSSKLSQQPSNIFSPSPTTQPSIQPSSSHSNRPSVTQSATLIPSIAPTRRSSSGPTSYPTTQPTLFPSPIPSVNPITTSAPSRQGSTYPISSSTNIPSAQPTFIPIVSSTPSSTPSPTPSSTLSLIPNNMKSNVPSFHKGKGNKRKSNKTKSKGSTSKSKEGGKGSNMTSPSKGSGVGKGHTSRKGKGNPKTTRQGQLLRRR